jgi:DNA-binding XRE family transcriptional regulator
MTPTEFKDARKALGLTQSQMAEALGLSPRTIRAFEADETRSSHKPIRPRTAMQVESLLANRQK